MLLKVYQKSWSILTAYLSVVWSKDRQTSQDKSLWLWLKKGIGEKEFYKCCQKPPFCICCEVVLNCSRAPGWQTHLFHCSHPMPSSFPVIYPAGKQPALLWQKKSLLGWHLQGDTFLACYSWGDMKLMIVQTLCGVIW